MTGSAQGYQVVFHIRTGLAPELNVMDLEIPHAPARLATPVVSFEYLPVQDGVALCV